MMKKVLLLCLVVVLAVGCRANQNRLNYDELCDSLVMLVQQGTLRNDTAMLKAAIVLSDSLLSVDTASPIRRLCYHHRAIVYSSLGHVIDAKKNFELEMQCLPENNPERLLFMATKSMESQKRDSVDWYAAELLSICERAEKNGFDENVVVYKLKALFLRYGEKKAQEYLCRQLAEHPDCQLLQYIKGNWKDFISTVNAVEK